MNHRFDLIFLLLLVLPWLFFHFVKQLPPLKFIILHASISCIATFLIFNSSLYFYLIKAYLFILIVIRFLPVDCNDLYNYYGCEIIFVCFIKNHCFYYTIKLHIKMTPRILEIWT